MGNFIAKLRYPDNLKREFRCALHSWPLIIDADLARVVTFARLDECRCTSYVGQKLS